VAAAATMQKHWLPPLGASWPPGYAICFRSTTSICDGWIAVPKCGSFRHAASAGLAKLCQGSFFATPISERLQCDEEVPVSHMQATSALSTGDHPSDD
jgi:hypothetical protein